MELKEKLGRIQADLTTNVEQSAKPDPNSKYGLKYAYSKESDVLKVIKPLLEKYKLAYSISQGETYKLTQGDNKRWVYESMGTFILWNTEKPDGKYELDAAAIKLNVFFTGENNDPAKAYGSALTYGVKFALKKIFGLPDDDLDPDNEQGQQNHSATKKEAPKQDSKYSKAMLNILKEVASHSEKGNALKERIRAFTGMDVPTPKAIVNGVQRDGQRMKELEDILNGGQE